MKQLITAKLADTSAVDLRQFIYVRLRAAATRRIASTFVIRHTANAAVIQRTAGYAHGNICMPHRSGKTVIEV